MKFRWNFAWHSQFENSILKRIFFSDEISLKFRLAFPIWKFHFKKDFFSDEFPLKFCLAFSIWKFHLKNDFFLSFSTIGYSMKNTVHHRCLWEMFFLSNFRLQICAMENPMHFSKTGFWNAWWRGEDKARASKVFNDFFPFRPRHFLTACSCNLLGTIGNYGCDKTSGQCTCKRFVVGEDCGRCAPGFWGLSEEQEGCKQCDCDLGGSYDNDCDQQTGQCRCRPNVAGRRCEMPNDGFFAPYLDYHTFEAENAQGSAVSVRWSLECNYQSMSIPNICLFF